MQLCVKQALRRTSARALVAALFLVLVAQNAHAGFISYAIRGTPIINPSGGSIEFIIDNSGDKAGLGSNDINGQRLGDITSLAISRLDDWTRFSAGSGPYVAPYFNIWITDGAGNFAVVANEPSDPEFQALYVGGSYNLSFALLAGQRAKVYENSDKSWLPNGGDGLTFADLANFVIAIPTVDQLTAGWSGLGTGAPREMGTNLAYGVSWIFGDTLSNYVSGDAGYIVANARVAGAVPEPGTLGLAGVALGTLVWLKRRR